jgi:hypothetical protein
MLKLCSSRSKLDEDVSAMPTRPKVAGVSNTKRDFDFGRVEPIRFKLGIVSKGHYCGRVLVSGIKCLTAFNLPSAS